MVNMRSIKKAPKPENYKTMLREIEKDLKKYKDISFLCMRRLSIVKVAIISKLINEINSMKFR